MSVPSLGRPVREVILSKAKAFLEDTADKGGSVVGALLFSPVDTLDRLGRFYKILTGAEEYKSNAKKSMDLAADFLGESKKYSILFLLETVEKDSQEKFNEIDLEKYDEDVDEAITVAGAFGATSPGAGHGGRTAPLSDPDRGSIYANAIKEQRERIAILQSYHQKTSNKLK